MRRITLQEAGLGVGAPGGDAIQPDDEALALEVHGGEVLLIVPAGVDGSRRPSARRGCCGERCGWRASAS